jgi:hypothetical protein
MNQDSANAILCILIGNSDWPVMFLIWLQAFIRSRWRYQVSHLQLRW